VQSSIYLLALAVAAGAQNISHKPNTQKQQNQVKDNDQVQGDDNDEQQHKSHAGMVQMYYVWIGLNLYT